MTDLRLEPVEIIGRDDLAYVWGRYSFVMLPPNARALAPPAAPPARTTR